MAYPVFRQAFVLLCCTSSVLTLDIMPVTKTSKPDEEVDIPEVSVEQLNEAYDKAMSDYESRRELEENIPPSGLILETTNYAVQARHQRFLAFKPRTGDLDFNASLFDSGTKFLKERLGLSNEQATFGLRKVAFKPGSKWDSTREQCSANFKLELECVPDSKFRTLDGSCNNLKNPTWGQAVRCMSRLLPPVYEDGIGEPRKSKTKKDLPKVRDISLAVHEALVTPNGTNSHFLTHFGQFVTHDVTMGLMTRTINNHTMLSCCPIGDHNHTECSMPIEIKKNENDFYSQHGETCMNFVRSSLCTNTCEFGPREHSTQITSFVDASNVYGSLDSDVYEIRGFKDGLLASQMEGDAEFLPFNDWPTTDQCSKLDKNIRCFKAGDKRVNEQPGLSSIHVIFLRQHNRLARIYKKKYPDYNDDQLYNMTRRIIGAQVQNVVFREFLPAVIGQNYIEHFQLTTGQRSEYRPDVDPSVLNEYMTAANRFGHVLIQNTFEKGPEDKSILNLEDIYFSPFILMDGELDPILKGMANQPGKQFEQHLVTAVTQTMYRDKEVPFGMDLASLNIQRGRDQGTAPYTQYIQHCFNKNITKFEDLDEFMLKTNRENLQKVYENVEDIDLFTGGVSEDRMTDAVVGPTFGCILGIQYLRLKYGDRFYYEHKDQLGSFTDEQLEQIRNSTMASIICANSNTIAKITPNIFIIPDKTNAYKDCKDIPKFDHNVF